jgi:hypothetical protein
MKGQTTSVSYPTNSPVKTNWPRLITALALLVLVGIVGVYLFGLPPQLQQYIPNNTNPYQVLNLNDVCREVYRLNTTYSWNGFGKNWYCLRNPLKDLPQYECLCYGT